MRLTRTAVIGLSLAGLGLVGSGGLGLVGRASAESVGQMLQGLTTGNQSQDDALRQAYERGYRNGQQDAARNNRSTSRDSSYGRDRNYDRDRDAPPAGYRDR